MIARSVCRYMIASFAAGTSSTRRHQVFVRRGSDWWKRFGFGSQGYYTAMASTSGCSLQFDSLEMSDSSSAMGGSKEEDFVTALASEAELATTTSLFASVLGESMKEGVHGGEGSTGARGVEREGEGLATSVPYISAVEVEEQIEASKVHWSELSESVCIEGEGVAEVSNVAVFKALQLHPSWGSFFQTFGYDLGGRYRSMGELEMGKKFAEGGQAELYEAKVQWWKLEEIEEDVKEGREFVLKVFKKGTLLEELKSQLPQGLLQLHVLEMKRFRCGTLKDYPRYLCHVERGVLLKDGRFVFLMKREHFDLRNFIDKKMKLRRGGDGGPFSKKEAESLIYRIALGLEWLHSHGIVHKDLKASNVLVNDVKGCNLHCFIADYECSNGVVGTGFFRAPEILQMCKDRSFNKKHEVFSRVVDVYSYGMVCYEVLTGKLPFQDHPLNDNRGNQILMDLVIKQHLRLEVLGYVENLTCEVLNMCWQANRVARPRIGEILDILSRNSTEAREIEGIQMRVYGKNFRSNLSLDVEF